MSEGRILAEGDAAAMISDPRVRHAYFGDREVAA
jgi:ABC-type branched-subunit amino acid transport system ATPase component